MTFVFDYDGTIHDSMRIYAPAFRKCCEIMRLDGEDVREYSNREIEKWIGMDVNAMWSDFRPDISENKKKKYSGFIGEYMEELIYSGRAVLYDGALEAVRQTGVYGKTVYDIEDVLCGRCDGDKAVVQSPLYPGLAVISAPYEGGIVRPAPLARLIGLMSPYFDFILLDTAAGMGPPFEAAAGICSRALLVLTPDPIALRDGRIVADRLIAGGHPQDALRLVVNRLRPDSFGRGAAVYDLDECIDTVGVQLLGVVPESRELQHCAMAGVALPAGCLAARAGSAIAQRLLGRRVPLLF